MERFWKKSNRKSRFWEKELLISAGEGAFLEKKATANRDLGKEVAFLGAGRGISGEKGNRKSRKRKKELPFWRGEGNSWRRRQLQIAISGN